ncbi:MAG: acyl dehydratase [Gammaproteobacteria bacterium]|nr:MAG: acyl dehydratase [Gammaproteobacteria bacterium]RLA62079.1 MAG: acyl dehydratase [Gammaproteobacteria bacterium]
MKELFVEGPYFEDIYVGQQLESPPDVTITAGYASWLQALFADRMRVPLSQPLSAAVLGSERPAVHPSLLCNVTTGQTTYITQEVKANLFYRGLVFTQPVFIDDTISTQSKVVALRQNKAKEGRAATGLVVLEMTITNQHGDEISRFWRCPMIPCRDPKAETGHNDDLDQFSGKIDLESVKQIVAKNWNLAAFRERVQGNHFDQIEENSRYLIKARDTVSCAPELVRLTLNMARAHTDVDASIYDRKLVYGGHVISMAAAQMVRALPNLVTIMGWRDCGHLAPVFEGDILRSEISITAKHPLSDQGGLLDIEIATFAQRGEGDEKGSEAKVLDWNLIGLMA